MNLRRQVDDNRKISKGLFREKLFRYMYRPTEVDDKRKKFMMKQHVIPGIGVLATARKHGNPEEILGDFRDSLEVLEVAGISRISLVTSSSGRSAKSVFV